MKGEEGGVFFTFSGVGVGCAHFLFSLLLSLFSPLLKTNQKYVE